MIESTQINDLLKKHHENKLPHAFLLETNDASRCFKDIISLIKQINCSNDFSDKCDKCNLCKLIDTFNLPSLVVIEPDGSVIKKTQILEMMDKFSTKPVFSKYNMYIVKEADRLNSSSGNTILKFLEEPEEGILGFFITNNKENILSTIRSRCQILSCYYSIDGINDDEELLDYVKIYINNIYKSKDDLLYNKTNMSGLFKERLEWERFFNTMLLYFRGILTGQRVDKTEVINKLSKKSIVKIINEVETILKYVKANGNIDLILDKFVIEMRDLYE